ncbi:TPA: YlcI/YnfO family protein [Campylobacter jejuni]
MTEEKESKGSYNLQIKIPNELKDKLEKKAEKAGVSLNQYIMYLFIDDIKNERIYNLFVVSFIFLKNEKNTFYYF